MTRWEKLTRQRKMKTRKELSIDKYLEKAISMVLKLLGAVISIYTSDIMSW